MARRGQVDYDYSYHDFPDLPIEEANRRAVAANRSNRKLRRKHKAAVKQYKSKELNPSLDIVRKGYSTLD